MTIKIGNYYVEYSNYSDYDINSGEAVISTGSTSNSYYFEGEFTEIHENHKKKSIFFI